MSHNHDTDILPVVNLTPVGLIEASFGDQVMTLDTEAARSLAVNLLSLVGVRLTADPPSGVPSAIVFPALLAQVADAAGQWRDLLADEPGAAPAP
ncbi:Uncharacterised protein (plasmid) [Tsukamurella tyrosinosolvens]|uniref:Uncharacterized protein n=1 Tax=Tsukamurella tyrosinosolvens TaxID=57704 RepID=A0A1H5AYH6_TSUTY|nr:hypothetical protein [Tsukamurella tyrosinosolvens]KXO95212.1 hypothetical protein AXK58_10780 [Tsukamurella tyrosinosolvens]SED47237.1 hypothetical protein SAMN04489793_5044 [Tsukamurella tyrosinosolvens]VEH88846.1 Uncharacterised protein [Tsukamurella tyrosinosolvens]